MGSMTNDSKHCGSSTESYSLNTYASSLWFPAESVSILYRYVSNADRDVAISLRKTKLKKKIPVAVHRVYCFSKTNNVFYNRWSACTLTVYNVFLI